MSKCRNGSWSKWVCVCPARLKFSKVCLQVIPWSLPVTSVCKKTALWFGWLTCRNPVGADPLVVRPVQAAPVQVVQVQVVQVQVVQLPVARVQPPLLRVPKAHVQAQAKALVLVLVLVLVLAQWGNAQGVLASPAKALPRTPRWLDRTLA